MRYFILLLILIFFNPLIINSAVKLKIIVNTNTLVRCERGYIVVQALNADDSIDTSWNGMVEVKSSDYRTMFRNEFQEKDYEGKISFFLTNGQVQMGDSTGKRGIGFWNFEPQTITLSVNDISKNSPKLTSNSVNVEIVDFNSSYNIIINEIMYRTVDDAKYEWIELYNNSDKDIPLNNFKLQRYSYNTYKGTGTTYEYTITTSNYIKAKSFAIICKSVNDLNTFFPDVKTNITTYKDVLIIGGLTLSLANDDAPIFLIDSAGNYCDGLIYKGSWGNEDSYNISIERKDKNQPAYLRNNWDECQNTEYLNYGAKGTPGKENSIITKGTSTELKINVSLNRTVFSPKANEYLEIRYTLTEFADVTLKIFNSEGAEVVQLLRHQSTAGNEEKIIKFYGKDKNNKTLPTGIYILYFEALNSETGKTAITAKSFVIGNKLE